MLAKDKLLQGNNQDKSQTKTSIQAKCSLPTILEETEATKTDNCTDTTPRKRGRPRKDSLKNIGEDKSATACSVSSEKKRTRSSLNEQTELNSEVKAPSEEGSVKTLNDINTSNKKSRRKMPRFKSEIERRIRSRLKSSSEKMRKECEPSAAETRLKRGRKRIENNDGEDSTDGTEAKRPRRISCEEENTIRENCKAEVNEELTKQNSGLKHSFRQNKTKDVRENNGIVMEGQSSAETKHCGDAVDSLEASSHNNELQAERHCEESHGVVSEKTRDMLVCGENEKKFDSLTGGSADEKDEESDIEG